MTDYDYLLKTSEIYPLDNRKLCPWFNVDNYYLRGMKHMWPATRVFHRSSQIICIRHDLKGSLIRILQRTESRFSNDTWKAKRRFFINVKDNNSSRPGGGGEETPVYKLYRYVPPHRPIGQGFCAVLVWTGVYTSPILVLNRVWFSRELRECMNVFIVSIPNE